MTDTRSRRERLAAVGAATSAAVAGCSSLDGPTQANNSDAGSNSGDETVVTQTLPDGVAQFRRSLERWGYYPDESVPDVVKQVWRIPEITTGDHSAAKASAVPTPDGRMLLAGDDGHLNTITADGQSGGAARPTWTAVGSTEHL